MNFDINKVKLSVTIPKERLEFLRNEICQEGAGVIGNYTYCSLSTKCIGTFKPSESAHPYVGNKNKLETVEEVKLEINCDIKKVKNVIRKIRQIHPYEEPVIDIIPLIDESNFN